MKNLKNFFATALCCTMCVMGATASPDVKYYQPRELIQVSQDSVVLERNQREAEVYVTSRSSYVSYCKSDWLTVVQEGNKVKATATENKGFMPRFARVIMTTEKENVSRVITFVQNPEAGHNEHFLLPKEGKIYPMVSMDLSKATHDKFIKGVRKNKSVDGNEIRIKNNTYETGIGTHAKSVFKVQLNGAARFVADMGLDDEVLTRDVSSHGDVKYKVLLDGKEVASGGMLITDNNCVRIDLNTTGAKVLELIFDPNGSTWGDHVDLGNPYFVLTGAEPVLID